MLPFESNSTIAFRISSSVRHLILPVSVVPAAIRNRLYFLSGRNFSRASSLLWPCFFQLISQKSVGIHQNIPILLFLVSIFCVSRTSDGKSTAGSLLMIPPITLPLPVFLSGVADGCWQNPAQAAKTNPPSRTFLIMVIHDGATPLKLQE